MQAGTRSKRCRQARPLIGEARLQERERPEDRRRSSMQNPVALGAKRSASPVKARAASPALRLARRIGRSFCELRDMDMKRCCAIDNWQAGPTPLCSQAALPNSCPVLHELLFFHLFL